MINRSDFEVLTLSGKQALSELIDMREDLPEGGSYPFLIGDEDSYELLRETYDFNKKISAAEIIEMAERISPLELFEQDQLNVVAENKPDFVGEWQHIESNLDIGLSWDNLVMSHHDILTKIPFEKCFLGIAPTVQSWQIPAFARFGDWNACPQPEEHCAIFQYWQNKYGAEIVSLTHDVIECCVATPPQTAAECWELAWQQFAYCSDLVEHGVGTIGNLASSLRNSSYWSFSWD